MDIFGQHYCAQHSITHNSFSLLPSVDLYIVFYAYVFNDSPGKYALWSGLDEIPRK